MNPHKKLQFPRKNLLVPSIPIQLTFKICRHKFNLPKKDRNSHKALPPEVKIFKIQIFQILKKRVTLATSTAQQIVKLVQDLHYLLEIDLPILTNNNKIYNNLYQVPKIKIEIQVKVLIERFYKRIWEILYKVNLSLSYRLQI